MPEAVQSKVQMVLLVKESGTKKDSLSLTTGRKKYSVDQDIGIKDFWGGRDHYRVEYTIPVYVEHQWEAYEYIYLCTVSGNLEQNMRNVPTMIHKNK